MMKYSRNFLLFMKVINHNYNASQTFITIIYFFIIFLLFLIKCKIQLTIHQAILFEYWNPLFIYSRCILFRRSLLWILNYSRILGTALVALLWCTLRSLRRNSVLEEVWDVLVIVRSTILFPSALCSSIKSMQTKWFTST